MALPSGLVRHQGLTWVGKPLPPPEKYRLQPGDRGFFLDYDGDRGHYVVEFNGAVFCCDAADVRADPRPPEPVTRRHNAT
ncbi:MAG: hypothetical protein QOE84_2603 [Actinomycetota bacterium]|jgi:hypothetical protein|nr:hypothetical protein [Actinomycetota bacterium]